MKLKFHFVLLVFCTVYFESKSQGTADFPDSNYRWNIYYDVSNFELAPRSWVDGSFYDKGDSIVQNKHYRKIYFKYTYFGDDYYWGPKGYWYGDDLYCLIRNDKQEKKCYIIRQNFSCNIFSNQQDSTEHLLYDFNLKVGDVYPVTIHNTHIDTNIYIKSIDTIIDPFNVKRATYSINNLNYMNKTNLIQGIGSVAGIHFGVEYINNNVKSVFQKCFKNNNVEISFNYSDLNNITLSNSSCNQHIYTFIQSEKIKNLNVFPNPSNKNISIDIVDPNLTFTMNNVIGQTQNIICSYTNGKWNFDISNLTEGIYFLKANSNNITYTGKFIKQ